jgi:hypothetical protein
MCLKYLVVLISLNLLACSSRNDLELRTFFRPVQTKTTIPKKLIIIESDNNKEDDQCEIDADCRDSNLCTIDRCDFNGLCVHELIVDCVARDKEADA